MTLTQSTMMKLGSPAPAFALPDTSGELVSKSDFAGQPLLVMFICNHCPYVKHVAPELSQLESDYASQGLAMVGIQSNDVEAYPDDAPELMKTEASLQGYRFPYLYDASQQVALSYCAACTPDFFLFDEDHKLVYRGRLDDTRPTRIRSGVYDSTGNQPNGKDLRAAIQAILEGQAPSPNQHPSLGCNIKWKPANEPGND